METSVGPKAPEDLTAREKALAPRIEAQLNKVPAWEVFSYEGYPQGSGDQERNKLEVKGVALRINGETLIIACRPPETWIIGFPGLEAWPKGVTAVIRDNKSAELRPATGQNLAAAETVLGDLAKYKHG